MITIEKKVRFAKGRRGQRRLQEGGKSPANFKGRIPRVSKMMALAIRFDGLIRGGIVKDQAELARLGQVTRARLTQIMSLLYLAPDIQEAILFLPTFERGRNSLTEKQLRPIASTPSWNKQRQMWGQLSTSAECEIRSFRSPNPNVSCK